jgi:hypothetical protein
MDSIEAGSVALRQWGPGDIADVTADYNNALIRRFLPHPPRPCTEAGLPGSTPRRGGRPTAPHSAGQQSEQGDRLGRDDV